MIDSIHYDVIISEKATQMLISHAVFLANVNEEAANRLIIAFEECAESLKFMPQRNPFFDAEYIPKNKYHKHIFEKRYLILYQIKDTKVYIDYVLDCRQNYQWLII